VEYGWLKDGAGDGNCISLIPILAHNEILLSGVDVELGLDGNTLQDSTGAGKGA